MSHWDFGRPSAGEYDAPRPGDSPVRDDEWGRDEERDDDDLAPYPLTFEREPAPDDDAGAASWLEAGPGAGADPGAGAGGQARRELPPPLPWEREPAGRRTRFSPRGGPWRTAGPVAPRDSDRAEPATDDTERFAAEPFSASAFGAAPFAADPFATTPFAGERAAEDLPAADFFAADPFTADPDSADQDPDPAGQDPAGGDRDAWEDWADWYNGGRRRGPAGGPDRGGRRWLVPAGLAVAAAALGAGAVLLTAGHPGAAGGQATPGTRAGTGTKAGAGPNAGTGSNASQGGGRSLAPSAASGGSGSVTASAGAGTPGSGAAGAGAAGAGSGAGAAALTMAEAKAVLAGYTNANNQANAQRSDTQLAAIETGSSYTLDAALYKAGQAAGTATYPPFEPVSATYYLPRNEPSAGPRWFVVQVANAFTASPAKVTSTEYLLFTQAAPGGSWLNTIEPYQLSGASAPPAAVGADGLATAVSAGTSADAVAPGQLPAVTAAALDGTGTGVGAAADPGNLADEADARLWRKDVAGAQVAARHAPAASPDGQEFALLASGGGALVFYTDAASLTVTPPAGSVLHVTIPGFYSPTQALTSAGVTYLEQFAAYDPPAGGGTPRIVADYSAVTGKS